MVVHYLECKNADIREQEPHICDGIHRRHELLVIVKQHRMILLRTNVETVTRLQKSQSALILKCHEAFLFHLS